MALLQWALSASSLRCRDINTRPTPAVVQSGMSVWHHDSNPNGKIVELHGNARYLICPECGRTAEATSTDLIHMKRYKPRICTACGKANLRFKIMLYDDEEAEMITPEDVWTRFEDDLETADLIVWVGISFEQVRARGMQRGVRLAARLPARPVTFAVCRRARRPSTSARRAASSWTTRASSACRSSS